jgi:hypothetical protein
MFGNAKDVTYWYLKLWLKEMVKDWRKQIMNKVLNILGHTKPHSFHRWMSTLENWATNCSKDVLQQCMCQLGCAIAQTANQPPAFNWGGPGSCPGSPCGVCGGQSGIVTGFSQESINMPCQYYSTTAPYSLVVWGWDSGRNTIETVAPHCNNKKLCLARSVRTC